MKNSKPAQALLILLLIVVAALGINSTSQKGQEPETHWPRAGFADATPLGGKGLRLLCEWLGHTVRRVDGPLQEMPEDAAIWVLADFRTSFSKKEMDQLQKWLEAGGTVFLALPPGGTPLQPVQLGASATQELASKWKLTPIGTSNASDWTWQALPPLKTFNPASPSRYWTGARQASASGREFQAPTANLQLGASVTGIQLARLDVGQGHVFVAADATLFTNYALSKPDTAALVTNIVRLHATPGARGVVYFDERRHGEDTAAKNSREKSWLWYLWKPPLRWAVLQIFGAALCLWLLTGRRLGAAVPLPVAGPVTRASQFAQGMGTLLHKGRRSRVAAEILCGEFRRSVAQKIGLAVSDSDQLLADRAAMRANLPAEHIARLLRVAKSPIEDEETLLNEVKQMEIVVRRMSH